MAALPVHGLPWTEINPLARVDEKRLCRS